MSKFLSFTLLFMTVLGSVNAATGRIVDEQLHKRMNYFERLFSEFGIGFLIGRQGVHAEKCAKKLK